MKKSLWFGLVANFAVLIWVVWRGVSDALAVDFQDLPWDLLVVVPLAAYVLLRFVGQMAGQIATRGPAPVMVGNQSLGKPLGNPPTTGTAVGKPQPPLAPIFPQDTPMAELVGGAFNGQRVPAPPPGEKDLVVRLGNSKVLYRLAADGRWWLVKGS